MSDVVQHSFYGGGGKLSKSIVKAVFVHGQPLPVDIASLEKSQAVPLQAVVVPGFAVLIEKERTQDVVNLLRHRFDGVAVLLALLLDGQKDVDGQAYLKHDDDGRAGGVAEIGGSRPL